MDKFLNRMNPQAEREREERWRQIFLKYNTTSLKNSMKERANEQIIKGYAKREAEYTTRLYKAMAFSKAEKMQKRPQLPQRKNK